MGRFWRFRMWLAKLIIGKDTAFYYNGNILSDGGIYHQPGERVFMSRCITGTIADIRARRARMKVS